MPQIRAFINQNYHMKKQHNKGEHFVQPPKKTYDVECNGKRLRYVTRMDAAGVSDAMTKRFSFSQLGNQTPVSFENLNIKQL